MHRYVKQALAAIQRQVLIRIAQHDPSHNTSKPPNMATHKLIHTGKRTKDSYFV